MGWVAHSKPEHECKMPKWESGTGVNTNDIWECPDCGQWHIVKVEYDQRDSTTWFTWRAIHKIKDY